MASKCCRTDGQHQSAYDSLAHTLRFSFYSLDYFSCGINSLYIFNLRSQIPPCETGPLLFSGQCRLRYSTEDSCRTLYCMEIILYRHSCLHVTPPTSAISAHQVLAVVAVGSCFSSFVAWLTVAGLYGTTTVLVVIINYSKS